jgi:hypothetical protein
MEDKRDMSDEELLRRLREQPMLRQRMVALLDIAEDKAGDLKLADDAELRLTQEIRRLGQELMQGWAEGQVRAAEQEQRRGGRAHREGKKN